MTTRRGFIQRTAVVAGAVAAGATPPLAAMPTSSSKEAMQPAADRQSKPATLRTMFETPGTDILIEGYTVLAARLAELHGFPAIYVGSSMMSALYKGVPDWAVIEGSEMAEIGGRIGRSVSIPVMVDADMGGASSLNVFHTIRRYEQANISGFHIQDSLLPKGLGPPQSRLMSVEEMQERIQAAVAGRTDPDFVIMTRTDAMRLGPNPEDNTAEVIRRGQAFAEAGSDVFMPLGIGTDRARLDRITSEVPLPLLGINMPMPEIRGADVRVNMVTGFYPAAMKLYETMIQEVRDQGMFLSDDSRRLTPETMEAVRDVPEFRRLAERWAALQG